MATVNPDMFHKLTKNIKLSTRQDETGNEIEVEVREDEEQSVKLQEIIDLLLGAGYFRARIKGLSPFDKVIGGMTWCIESCNVDIDIDLLFEENLTIGQKISLTEKIVAVLPKLKCPHQIEPHQIQGLDFINIFPVIQWLVKRSMEHRKEMSAFNRSYAIRQFEKSYGKVDEEKEKLEKKIYCNAMNVLDIYRPQRFYKRKNEPPEDILSKVQITLLEYGRKGGLAYGSSQDNAEAQIDMEEHKKEELHLQQLFKSMALTSEESIAFQSLTKEEKENWIKHYESVKEQIQDGGVNYRKQQKIQVLNQEKQILEDKNAKLKEEVEMLKKKAEQNNTHLQEVRNELEENKKALQEITQTDISNTESFKDIEELVVLNDSLKLQEQQFREHCKQELVKLQNLIQQSKNSEIPKVDTSESKKLLDEEMEKVRVLRLHLAKRNRNIAGLQRQLDEVPSRAELAQYQRRFLELYNQVSAKHKETKQYYTLYNTLEDTKFYIKKELTLLNSISENYQEAMCSTSAKAEFLGQFESIVDAVKQTKSKMEKKLQEERQRRDALSAKLQQLVELQRKYVAAVRQLTIECRKNEALLAQINV